MNVRKREGGSHLTKLRRHGLLLCVFGCVATIVLLAGNRLSRAAFLDPPDANADLQKLQGDWQASEAWFPNGRKWPDEEVKTFLLEFRMEKMITITKAGKELVLAVKLDPMKNPKTIDGTFVAPDELKDKAQLGIYELKGDTLKIALGKTTENNRPTGFEPGMGWSITVWKRPKAEP